MKENVNFGLPSVKGHCRVELRDAKTGKLTDVREGDNFLSYGLLNTILKQMQKAVFAGLCPNAGLGLPPFSNKDLTYGYAGAFRYLVLTDSTMAESPDTEHEIPGNVVGWGDRSLYTGTDALRGSLNYTESCADEHKVRWVFDFGTEKANGIINSVCWAYVYPEQKGKLQLGTRTCGSNIQHLATLPRYYRYNKVVYGDGYFWGCSPISPYSILYKIDPVTYQEVAEYTIDGLGTYGWPFVVQDGYMYFAITGSKIRKLRIADMTYIDSPSTYSNYKVIGTDGTHIYICYLGGSAYTRQLRMTDLVQVGYQTGITPFISGMFFIDDTLYIVYSHGLDEYSGIFIWDFVSNTFTRVNPAHFQMYDTVWFFTDGTNLYLAYAEKFPTVSVGIPTETSSNNRTQLALIPSLTGLKMYNLMARKLLDTPIVKTNAHVMKIIYEFTFG